MLESLDLVVGSTFSTGLNGTYKVTSEMRSSCREGEAGLTSVTHGSTGRRGATGDESDDGLGYLSRHVKMTKVVGSFLLHRSTNLSDQHDTCSTMSSVRTRFRGRERRQTLGSFIIHKHFEDVNVLRSRERISSDSWDLRDETSFDDGGLERLESRPVEGFLR